MTHDSTAEKKLEWERQRPVFDAIKRLGFQKFVETLPGISRAFQLADRNLRCIDEGTPGGIHAAGSGILMDEAQVLSATRAARVEGVLSHAGCGAAALFAKQKGLDESRADEYGRQWAEELAKRLDVPYRGYIGQDELKRPADFHNARVTYSDGTGVFDPSRVSGLPPGFVVSRRYLEPDYAKREVEVSVAIATGDHGYGGLITSEEPFYIVAVGDPEDARFSSAALQDEVEDVAKKFGGRVKTASIMLSYNHALS